MKKVTNFAYYLSSFFMTYLPKHRNLSEHTIKSYRDTFKIFLRYCTDVKGLSSEKITLEDISNVLVLEFLDYLENERGCSITTRNQRLSAISAFFQYVFTEIPDCLLSAQKIFLIPFKKHEKQLVNHISASTIKKILELPDTKTCYGRRDCVLLSVLYDTAARVSELSDIRARNVKLSSPATILLNGKGDKPRLVPVMSSTRMVLKTFIKENKLDQPENLDTHLFLNHRREQLTTEGITYILKKYVDMARATCFDLPKSVTPHVFRHSKAMHLLEAGVDLIYIRDFLGHEDIKTTEIYAKSSPEKKQQAIINAGVDDSTVSLPDWNDDKALMSLLYGV